MEQKKDVSLWAARVTHGGGRSFYLSLSLQSGDSTAGVRTDVVNEQEMVIILTSSKRFLIKVIFGRECINSGMDCWNGGKLEWNF